MTKLSGKAFQQTGPVTLKALML